MQRNLSGKPIRSLQIMLRNLESFDDRITAVVPDGIYGEATKSAVESFQQVHGLPVTGTADLYTWESIVREHDRHEVVYGSAYPLYIKLQPGQIIIPGEENLHMYVINGALQALSTKYESMPMVDSGGLYTEESVEAVKWLQKMAQMETDGYIDRQTWRMLAGLYRATAGDGTGKRG